jgi:hypothetical protein
MNDLTLPEMLCPVCQKVRVSPVATSEYRAVLWYACPACEGEWSTRIRIGQPDPIVLIKRADDEA